MLLLGLFAQAVGTPDATTTWVAVAVAGVSMLANVATGGIACIQLLINKKYDAELNKLKADHAHCVEQHQEAEKEREQERKEKHEIRNELNVLKLKLEMMEERARRRHPDEYEDARTGE